MSKKYLFWFIMIMSWVFGFSYLCAVNMGRLDKMSEVVLLFVIMVPSTYGFIRLIEDGK
jgi:uncharacterized membrane protein